MSQKIKSLDQDNVKFLCGLIRNIASIDSAINDLVIATDKVWSSKKYTDYAQEIKHDLEAYIQSSINGLTHLKKKIVDTLPSDADAEENILYLVKDTSVVDDVVYNQYLLIDGVLEPLGRTSTDISNYYNKDESDAKFALLSNLQTLIDMVGNASDLETTKKDTLVNAINEIKEGLDNCITKENIVTSLDDTVTDEQVASALATYNMVKDKNLKTYSDFSQISTTATNLSEYVQAMANNSIASLNLQMHTSEFIGDTKNIVNNGGNIWGTLLVQKINAGRTYLRLNQIGGGYYKGTFEASCTENANYILEWRKVLVSEDKYSHISLSSNNADKFMINLNVLTLPLGEYQISNASFGKTLVNLPPSSTVDIAGRLSVQSLSSSKSEINMLYTTTYTYRTFIYHNLDGNSWIRIVNSGGTVGVFEKDTGWQRICTTKTTNFYNSEPKFISESNYKISDVQNAYIECKNGWVFVSLPYVNVVSPTSGITTLIKGLPKPRKGFWCETPSHVGTGNEALQYGIDLAGAFQLAKGSINASYRVVFSYPVAE